MIEKQRIQKYLSGIGFCSRRKAEKFILHGMVKVNGKISVLGEKFDPLQDMITVNNQKINNYLNKKYYIMLNKPKGYITTLNDERNRKCVANLVKNVGSRVYPVGRLDKDSEGLLLFTNDGDFANKVMHPSEKIFKTYMVTVNGEVTKKIIQNFELGIDIDNKRTFPAKAELILKENLISVLKISISEGKNRQIRKMCENQGLKVIKLKRIKIGELKLGAVDIGMWRKLDKKDILKIFS